MRSLFDPIQNFFEEDVFGSLLGGATPARNQPNHMPRNRTPPTNTRIPVNQKPPKYQAPPPNTSPKPVPKSAPSFVNISTPPNPTTTETSAITKNMNKLNNIVAQINKLEAEVSTIVAQMAAIRMKMRLGDTTQAQKQHQTLTETPEVQPEAPTQRSDSQEQEVHEQEDVHNTEDQAETASLDSRQTCASVTNSAVEDANSINDIDSSTVETQFDNIGCEQAKEEEESPRIEKLKVPETTAQSTTNSVEALRSTVELDLQVQLEKLEKELRFRDEGLMQQLLQLDAVVGEGEIRARRKAQVNRIITLQNMIDRILNNKADLVR